MIDASPARTWQLQAQPTPLLGRDRELETIQRLLQAEHVRLLTLTGPAGVGKTRLAIEAGSRMAGAFPDGVSFIDLSPVRDPRLVLPAIAQQLGIRDAGDRLVNRIPASLQDRRVLLILDNVEQVLPTGEYLAKLVAASPSVTWLVTSRVPLQLRWEQLLRIAPLAVPDRTALPALDELAQTVKH